MERTFTITRLMIHLLDRKRAWRAFFNYIIFFTAASMIVPVITTDAHSLYHAVAIALFVLVVQIVFTSCFAIWVALDTFTFFRIKV